MLKILFDFCNVDCFVVKVNIFFLIRDKFYKIIFGVFGVVISFEVVGFVFGSFEG